jgi:hypothetical protein
VNPRHTTEQPSFALFNGQIHPIRMPTTAKLGLEVFRQWSTNLSYAMIPVLD